MNENHSPISSDERLMGAIPHLFGFFVALIVWALQKDKSRFVRFQALQALAFYLIIVVVAGFLFTCLFGVMFLGIFGSSLLAVEAVSSSDQLTQLVFLPFIFQFAAFSCITPLSLLILAVRIFAFVSVLNGHNFRYPLIGNWAEKFLD
jgi:uncharacterized Tic20 family protein